MKQLKKKLHSNEGSSIILALVLMLICIMVSSVIIAAAASGVGRNKIEAEKQKEYLAITSAAQYLAEELNKSRGDSFCGVTLKNLKPCSKYRYYMPYEVRVWGEEATVYGIPTPYASIDDDLSGVEILQFYLWVENPGTNIFCGTTSQKTVLEEGGATSFSGTFAQIMKDAATEVYKSGVAYMKEFTIIVDDTRIPDVKCKFKMDKEYHVTVVVSSAIADGSEYSMTVEMPVKDRIDNTTGHTTTETCSHMTFYERVKEETGNVEATDPKLSTFTHQVDNPTTTIIWGTPKITKGGV